MTGEGGPGTPPDLAMAPTSSNGAVAAHEKVAPAPRANGATPAAVNGVRPPARRERPARGKGLAVAGGKHPVIALRNIVKTYQMGDVLVQALRGVSLTIEKGDFVAIMGASGSGKSTMMNIIGCLDVPTRGRYYLDGVDVRTLDEAALSLVRSKKVGFVFQSFNLIARTTALANVELPLVYAGVKPKERKARAIAALQAVGLGARLEHFPSEMSGGQQQRAAVARAIVTNPALVLADEPTGNLDSTSTFEVMQIFSRLNAEGRTIVIITHEDDVADFAKRIVRLRDGQIIEDRRQSPLDALPPKYEPPAELAESAPTPAAPPAPALQSASSEGSVP